MRRHPLPGLISPHPARPASRARLERRDPWDQEDPQDRLDPSATPAPWARQAFHLWGRSGLTELSVLPERREPRVRQEAVVSTLSLVSPARAAFSPPSRRL